MIEEAQKRNSGNQIEYRISGLEEPKIRNYHPIHD